MTYDMEKYREKREKVLGFKKRGMSFGVVSAIVSICIILGLGVIVTPKAVSFVITRNLNDAIYKLENSEKWPPKIITNMAELKGVEKVLTDKNSTRLVVTFNRQIINTDKLTTFFKQNGLVATLLNNIGHRQRIADLEKEETLEAL